MTVEARPESLESDLAALVRSGVSGPDHPVRVDPYPFYDRLRAQAPVYRSDELGLTFVTSYELTQRIQRDNRWSSRFVADAPITDAQQAFVSGFAFQDPLEHTRLRKLCAAVFTPKAVEEQRANADRIARDLLTELRARETFNYQHDFAYLLPQRLISDMLGIPPTERESFVRWSTDLSKANEPQSSDSATGGTASRSSAEMMAFFADLIRSKRADPGPDLISRLLVLHESGEQQVTAAEVMSTAIMLYQGGFSTTTNLLTNMMLTLIRHPAVYAELRADPGLVPAAVEETIRYESPIRNAIGRRATVPIELGDHTFEPGEKVYAILAAANRDPAVFQDPHTYDIHRPTSPRHVGFGGGIHVCIGASLARVEVQEAFRQLMVECPPLELAVADVRWQDSFTHRRVHALPVLWQRSVG